MQEIIERWAPRNENETDAYAESVRRQCGFKRGEQVDLHEFDQAAPLIRAMIRHENGCMPYSDSQICKGLVLAGIEPRTEKKSRTMRGAQLGGGMTVLGTASAYADQIGGFWPPIANVLGMIPPWLIGAAALAGIGYRHLGAVRRQAARAAVIMLHLRR